MDEFDELNKPHEPAENSWLEMRKLFLDMTAAGFTESQTFKFIMMMASAHK